MKVHAGRQLLDVNVALIAITPFETPPRLLRTFNQSATTKLLIFIAPCSPRKMLQYDIWQIAISHILPKLLTIDYLKAFCQTAQLGSESGHSKESDIPFLFKNIDCND